MKDAFFLISKMDLVGKIQEQESLTEEVKRQITAPPKREAGQADEGTSREKKERLRLVKKDTLKRSLEELLHAWVYDEGDENTVRKIVRAANGLQSYPEELGQTFKLIEEAEYKKITAKANLEWESNLRKRESEWEEKKGSHDLLLTLIAKQFIGAFTSIVEQSLSELKKEQTQTLRQVEFISINVIGTRLRQLYDFEFIRKTSNRSESVKNLIEIKDLLDVLKDARQSGKLKDAESDEDCWYDVLYEKVSTLLEKTHSSDKNVSTLLGIKLLHRSSKRGSVSGPQLFH
jgi:hypothetical protein